MIRKLLLLALTLTAAMYTGAAAAPAEPTGPNLVVPQARVEFAPVAEGTEVVHEFTLRNEGRKPLLIEKVRTG